jgi:ribosomal protein S27AE
MSKYFDILNINVAISTVILLSIMYFVNKSNIIPLIIVCFFVFVSFILENSKTVTYRNRRNAVIATSPYENHKNAAIYAYIDVLAAISNINKNIFSRLEEGENLLLQNEIAVRHITTVIGERIADFLSFQKNECESLLGYKSPFESAFLILEKTASRYNEKYEALMEKIQSCAAGLHCLEKSESLLEELRLSFQDAYNQGNEDIMNQIDGLIDRINILTLRTGSMQSFPKSYRDAVELCSVKMENVLNALGEAIKSKRELITGICGMISESVLVKDRDMAGVQEKITDYLLKNTFVLTKIMETYASSNPELKNLIARKQNAPLRKKKFCNVCGEKIGETHTYCPKCGNSVYLYIEGN